VLEYFLYILTLVSILGIATMAYNVTAGFAGMFSLAHAGFLGIGAYVSSLVLLRLGLPAGELHFLLVDQVVLHSDE
jgi:branched-chain amino acid transport system permease protein